MKRSVSFVTTVTELRDKRFLTFEKIAEIVGSCRHTVMRAYYSGALKPKNGRDRRKT